MADRRPEHAATQRPKVVAVVGPTAVGKTAVAVHLAAELGGEVVSLDSRQMYRRLDIGTAKPDARERGSAPHHLVDVAEPDEVLTLADVQGMALAAIDDIAARGRLPILAGGTGQYVTAVLEGWRIPRVPPDTDLRARLRREAALGGSDALHARLAQVDPISAERIDRRNVRRVIRALEVHELTGRPISELQARQAPPFESLVIGLFRPRSELYNRIDRRIDAMLDAGLEDEVRGLLAAGYGFDLPSMSGVGYGEWSGYFEASGAEAGGQHAASPAERPDRITREEVVRLIRRDSRRLARSQASWFRLSDRRIRWFEVDADTRREVLREVRRFLTGGPRREGDATFDMGVEP